MKVEQESLEQSQLKLTIELSQEEMLPFIEKAARKFAENMNIDGFRKGQAPLDVVKTKVGEMELLQQAAELAVQATLPKAIEEKSLQTVGQPAIAVDKLAPENPFVFTATLPIIPEVTVGDVTKVKAEKAKVDVTEEDVTKVIDNLRKMRASQVLVDREAKKDDRVELNFKVFLDNVPVDGGSGDKYPLTIGENTMIPGFEDNLIGMKKDEEKEFKLAFPKDYHNKQLAGNECDFKVKLLSVFEVQLPELNEEFAKMLGDYDSVEALKDAIEKNLHEDKEKSVDNAFERDVVEGLVEISKFGDIPEVMLTQEAQQMLRELEQNIARQGLSFDDYLRHIKKDRQQLLLDFTPDAVKRIKAALLIKKVAEDQKLEVTEAEMKEELDTMQHAAQGDENFLKQLESKPYQDYMKNVLRNKKAVHWLKEQVAK